MSAIDTIERSASLFRTEADRSAGRRESLFSTLWQSFRNLRGKELTRRALEELTDEQLWDIGLTRDEAREGGVRSRPN
jgi:uncharacterized protein YjiS (DUF1127 family)